MIKIGIADDHETFRTLFSEVFDDVPDIDMVLQATNGLDLLKQLESNPVDAVFLDLEMPILDGIETLKRLKTSFPNVKVVNISLSQDEFLILQLVKLGARGFLMKDSDPDSIVNSIESVMNAGYYFAEPGPRVVLKSIVRSDLFPLGFNPNPELSEQEKKTIGLLAKKMSKAEIATELGLSVEELGEVEKSLKPRLGVHDRNGFRMYAQKHKDQITTA